MLTLNQDIILAINSNAKGNRRSTLEERERERTQKEEVEKRKENKERERSGHPYEVNRIESGYGEVPGQSKGRILETLNSSLSDTSPINPISIPMLVGGMASSFPR